MNYIDEEGFQMVAVRRAPIPRRRNPPRSQQQYFNRIPREQYESNSYGDEQWY
jgi:hypothetical protein